MGRHSPTITLPQLTGCFNVKHLVTVRPTHLLAVSKYDCQYRKAMNMLPFSIALYYIDWKYLLTYPKTQKHQISVRGYFYDRRSLLSAILQGFLFYLKLVKALVPAIKTIVKQCLKPKVVSAAHLLTQF